MMHTLRRYHVKNVLCNPNTQWSCWVTAVTAMKRKGKETKVCTYTRKMLACALSRLLCHWCCLTVPIAPVHGVFLLSTWCFLIFSFFPSPHFIPPDVKALQSTLTSFFSLLLHGSSCDSCSIKWLWQRQQHKQLTCIINSIQAATQKVKGKEAHRPLQNHEICLPTKNWFKGGFFSDY